MTRRKLEERIHLVVLLAAAGWMFPHFARHEIGRGMWGLGAYAGFLLVFYTACRFSIPKERRRIPPIPPEFGLQKRTGSLNPGFRTVLAGATVVRQKTHRSRLHTVRRIERIFPEGTWILEAETTPDELVAICASFASAESNTLDTGWATGTGILLNNDPS